MNNNPCFCCRKCETDYLLFQQALNKKRQVKDSGATSKLSQGYSPYRSTPVAMQNHLAGVTGYLNTVYHHGEVCVNCGNVGGYK